MFFRALWRLAVVLFAAFLHFVWFALTFGALIGTAAILWTWVRQDDPMRPLGGTLGDTMLAVAICAALAYVTHFIARRLTRKAKRDLTTLKQQVESGQQIEDPKH